MKSLDTEMKGSMVRKRETEKRLKYKNIIQILDEEVNCKSCSEERKLAN